MTCYPCPKQDRAEALAADSRRQVDAAWRRLRLIYLAAQDAGLEIGEESLRAHFIEGMVHDEHSSRCSDALAGFHAFVVQAIWDLSEAGMADAQRWEVFTSQLRRKYPRHPASDISMKKCRETVHANLRKLATDCPPPDDPLDPYGTPPLLGVEWSEQQSGCRVARYA